MGVVYAAERIDGHFEQSVALKLVSNASLNPDAETRFVNERQILAKLQHPNICHLLDGGVSEGGRPYFVMELVGGRRIDEYCDAERLVVRDRMSLFLQVCDAVQHAHSNLVLHRDLKPGTSWLTRRVRLGFWTSVSPNCSKGRSAQ